MTRPWPYRRVPLGEIDETRMIAKIIPPRSRREPMVQGHGRTCADYVDLEVLEYL